MLPNAGAHWQPIITPASRFPVSSSRPKSSTLIPPSALRFSAMTSRQYEELCRFFLADLFQIGIHQVLSMEMMNPARPNFPSYRHQIDLYWDIETEAARYLHIANAKFRAPPLLIDQRDVLL